MSGSSGGATTLIAAVLISTAIVGASFFVANSLDRTTVQIELATAALEDLEVAAPPSAVAAAPAPNRPDPNREYEIDLNGAPVKGGENAKITIVEWSDFQCPFCSRVSPTLAQIEAEYGDQVRIAFKHMPLAFHAQAPAAHAASEAAHLQGKFWEMHDKIFANQTDLSEKTLEGYANEIGLDVDRYRKDTVSEKVKAKIAEDMTQASELAVTGTPAFFINGKFLSGAQPFANFKRLIDVALEKG